MNEGFFGFWYTFHRNRHHSFLAFAALFTIVGAAGPHLMQPRVPNDQLEEARALANPLPNSAEVVAQGKTLYEGKGTCANCHGINGNGRGLGAASLNPPPRNFLHHGFWRHRTEGEIFWVIKHGSQGTAMIPFGGLLSDDEIWTIIRYEQTFSHSSGRDGGKGPRGEMGPGMRSGGPGQHQGRNES